MLDQPETITGTLTFAVDIGEKPVTYPEKDVNDPTRTTGKYEDREVELCNGRLIRDQLSLDNEGFTLIDSKTATTDFYDEEAVKGAYYDECMAIVKEHTGADEIVVIDHTIRVQDEAKRKEMDVRAPVPSVHNDFTDWSGRKRVHDIFSEDEAEDRLTRRVVSVNVWRPIMEPVMTDPLVLCDATTLGEGDLIAADHIYSYRRGETFRVAHSDSQKWYFFPEMTMSEAVLIKCFDTETDRTRFNAHGAARIAAPEGVAPRESIEVRTLAFFND